MDYKLETYLKIARLYLEDDDPVQAESFINRASLLQVTEIKIMTHTNIFFHFYTSNLIFLHSYVLMFQKYLVTLTWLYFSLLFFFFLLKAESKNEQLQVYYKVCYARVLDYRRKFIEAAQRYNELSYRTIIHDDERMTALRNALICTILASAGQQRSRMLATLFKDERCQQLQAYSILEKMYLDRIIRRKELIQLDTLLQPHQKAKTSDGITLRTELVSNEVCF